MHIPSHPETISAIQKAVEEEAEALHLSLDHPHIVQLKADLLSLVELAQRSFEESAASREFPSFPRQ